MSTLSLALTAIFALAPARVVTSSEDAFTRSVMTILKSELDRAKTAASVEVHGSLSLKVSGGGKELALGLDRPWAACQRQPAGCQETVETYVHQAAPQLALAMQGEPPLEAKQLRLIVRDVEYVDNIKKVMPGLVARPLAGRLWVVLVADFPTASKPLDGSHLAALELDKAHAEAVALANTKQETGKLAELAKLPTGQQLAYMTPAGYYNCAWLASPSDWAALAKRMKGHLLLSVPNDEMVLYVDSASPAADAALLAITQRMHQEANRPVSLEILEWSPGGWKVWKAK